MGPVLLRQLFEHVTGRVRVPGWDGLDVRLVDRGGRQVPRVDDQNRVFSRKGTEGSLDDITCFFRYRGVMERVADYISGSDVDRPAVLSAPDSVGCQSFSLASVFGEKGLYRPEGKNPQIHSTDISAAKMAAARTYRYPVWFMFEPLTSVMQDFAFADGYYTVRPHLRDRVHFLAPCDLVANPPRGQMYFATLCMSLACYLREPEQERLVNNLLEITSHMLCMTHLSPEVAEQAIDKAREKGLSHLAVHEVSNAECLVLCR